jgi:formate C-acetyltransferase
METHMLSHLREEMTRYYTPRRRAHLSGNRDHMSRRERVFAELDDFASANPGLPAALLKARNHEVLAESFEPAIFRHSPFFFEMGITPSECWGTPVPPGLHNWLFERRHHVCHSLPQNTNLRAFAGSNPAGPKVWNVNDVFDFDHHCVGYTRILRDGFAGVLAEIAQARPSADADGLVFLEAAERGVRALLRSAERFAEKAEAMLAGEEDPAVRRNLLRISEAARRVPLLPPRTFHEGLACLLFVREGVASLEGIGVSVIGHIDRMLAPLYEEDLATGRLTRDEAGDLIARWMQHTDIKFHVEDNQWPETSTCIELGGCTPDGAPLFTDLTRLVIETHRRHGLINPKLNCRVSSRSPREWLDLLSETVLAGHNHIAILNDDVLIPANVHMGKSEADARLYVNGGCQETMIEGCEHSAGAYYYFNLARVLDLCLRQSPFAPEQYRPEAVAAYPRPVEATDFPSFYAGFVRELRRVMHAGAQWLREAGEHWPDVLPCPLFSATLAGCIANGRDYTAGGAKYNPAGIALVGLGTVVDSLVAVKHAVFTEGWLTMDDLRRALAADWDGHETLRQRLLGLPKFGHGEDEADQLAGDFSRDLTAMIGEMTNERGGPYQASFFVYYAFVHMGAMTRATPDGRHDGEMLSQGVAPGRLRPARSLTETIQGLSRIDFRNYPGNAVLDAQLPAGRMSASTLSAVVETFVRNGAPTLQPNCVSVDDLRDAQQHPERHRALTVRISGLSARFVALARGVQDEIISRTVAAS